MKSHLKLSHDHKDLCYDVNNYQLRMNDVVRKYQIGHTACLKVELLLNDLLIFFKMDQTFVNDSLHRTESLIWSFHILLDFFYYSNYKLKINGFVRKISHKTSQLVELLTF